MIFSGFLPAGLTLSSDGKISGTPTAATSQAAAFSVTATIGEGTSSASSSKTFAINVLAGTSDISITSGSGTYTYGDTITISGSIAASATPPASNGINAITEPAQNQVGLYLGDAQLATANVGEGGAFTLTYDTAQKGITPGETAQTLTVRYGGSSNLNSGTATVQITLKPKSIEAKFNGPLTKVYDGTTAAPTDLELKLYDVLTGDDVSVTCDSIAFDTAEVGDNRLITATGISLSGNDAKYYVLSNTTATTSGSISKATLTLTLTADPAELSGGGTVALTLTGNLPRDVTVKVACSDDAIQVNPGENNTWTATLPNQTEEYTFAATSGSNNYTVAGGTCTVSVTQQVPPANPNYRVDIPTPEHGTVTADPAAAKAGETVSLTPTPEEGYEVGEVTVTDRFGDTVEVTENADGTYTFTMPSGQVSVNVTFVEATPEPLPFTDVAEGDWFHDAVRYAYENGLMDGVGDGQFAPNATTNRAMVVTILYRLAGEPAVSGDVGFTDAAPGQWYTNAVAWAAQKGIVNGISDTEFAPSGDLTREQLATVLYRYAESMGYDVSAQADLSGFPDAGDIQSYATEALSWAVAEGLLQGFEDDSLRPGGTATRAQIATILMRFCETVAK